MRYIQFVFMVTDYAVYISHVVRHFFKERQKKAYTFLLKKLAQTGDVKFCTLKYSKIPLCTLYTQKVISDEVIVFWRAFARLTDKKKTTINTKRTLNMCEFGSALSVKWVVKQR